jgi:hypothetical protein
MLTPFGLEFEVDLARKRSSLSLRKHAAPGSSRSVHLIQGAEVVETVPVRARSLVKPGAHTPHVATVHIERFACQTPDA